MEIKYNTPGFPHFRINIFFHYSYFLENVTGLLLNSKRYLTLQPPAYFEHIQPHLDAHLASSFDIGKRRDRRRERKQGKDFSFENDRPILLSERSLCLTSVLCQTAAQT